MSEKKFKLEDTYITEAGVMRCCRATVASEYEGKTVQLGDGSRCQHCNEQFVLAQQIGKKPRHLTEAQWKQPVWIPEWQATPDKFKTEE